MYGSNFNNDAILGRQPLKDESVTEDKLALDVKTDIRLKQIGSYSVSPIYKGDYLTTTDSIPSACIRINNYFYCIDAPSRDVAKENKSNYGYVRRFDIVNNSEDTSWAKQILTGHGNSICRDTINHIIYIAPIWDTTSGSEVGVRYLYKYDETFEYLGNEKIPSAAMGCSYDHKTNKLYYYDYNHKIWVKQDNDWTNITTVDFSNVPSADIYTRTYNQDFTVYDNLFYISSPTRNVLFGDIQQGSSSIQTNIQINHTDMDERFRLGEIEGYEFYTDGRLYAVDFVELSSECRNAFVVELNFGSSIAGLPSFETVSSIHDGTLSLTYNNQKRFTLGGYAIRSLLQVKSMILSRLSTRITITGEVVDPYNIDTVQDMQIYLSGQYTCKTIDINAGTLSIYPTTSDNLLTVTSSSRVFAILRSSSIRFAGQYALNISAPNIPSGRLNSLVDVGYAYGWVSIRIMPNVVENKQLLIGQYVPTTGLIVGTLSTIYHQTGKTYNVAKGSILPGFVNEDCTTIVVSVASDRPGYEASQINITEGQLKLYNANGLVETNEGNGSVTLYNNSYYTITANWFATTGYVNIQIQSPTPFQNIQPNSIVNGVVSETINYIRPN